MREEPLQDLAARDAPALLEAVIEDAKRQAMTIVRERLVDLYVHQMDSLAAGRAPAAPVVSAAPKATPAVANGPVRRGWYVYGLAGAGPGRPELGEGIGGAPVEAVAAGQVLALGSWLDVDASAWGLSPGGDVDLDTLGPLARQHEAVLERVLESGPVIPFRFGTVYPGPDEARQALARHAGEVAATLEQIGDKVEWGLTVERAKPAAGPSRAGATDSYLAQRRAELDQAAEQQEQARQVAELIHETLCRVAAAAVVHGARRMRTSGHPVVLDASYLVPRADEARFRAAASDALAAGPEGIGLAGELTGPWPPYNFADVELEGATV